MKNFASILTFIAISASVVSSRALPVPGTAIQARGPYPVGNTSSSIVVLRSKLMITDEGVYARSPKKNKTEGGAAAGMPFGEI